jgi:hypothetical protein
MPEFQLHANGIPFTVTAENREEAAAGLSEAIDKDPSLLDKKAKRLGLTESDVETVGRTSRGESADKETSVAKGVGFAAQSTAEAVREGISRLPEQVAQIAIDTFGSDEQAQAAKAQIDERRAQRLQDSAGRVQTMFGEDEAAADALIASFDRNAELGQAAVLTLATGGTGGAIGQGVRSTIGRIFKDGIMKKALTSQAAGTIATGASFGAIVDTAGETVEERQEDRLGNAKFGAALGLGFQGAIATIGGIRRLVTQPIRKALESSADDAEKAVRATSDRGSLLSLGQRTGANFLINMENFVAGTFKNKFMREQADNILGGTRRLIKGIGSSTRPAYNAVIKRVGKSIEARVEALNVLRRDVWKTGMAKVDKLAIDEGNMVIQPSSLRGALADIEADMGSAALSQIELGKGMATLGEEVATAIKSGGATVRQVNEWMKGIEFAKRGGNIFTNGESRSLQGVYLNQLRSGLLDDVGRLAAQGRPSKAFNELVKVRDDYKQVVNEIRGFEGETALAMLRNPKNADDAIRAIGKLDDEGQVALRSALLKMDDGAVLHQELSGSLLRRAIDDSFVVKGDQFRRFDLNKFRKNLRVQAVPGKPGEQIRIDKFLSPADLKNAEETALIASKVMNLSESVGKTNLTLGDVAINAISRSAEFIARMVTRVATGGQSAEWLFFTREGQEWITKLATAKATGNAVQMNRLVAMGAYAAGAADNEAEIVDKPGQRLSDELGL